MLEAMGELMGYPYCVLQGYKEAKKTESSSSQTKSNAEIDIEAGLVRKGATHGGIAPYGPVTTKEGKSTIVAVQSQREWISFCNGVLLDPQIISHPLYDTNMKRVANRTSLTSYIHNIISKLTFQELEKRLIRFIFQFLFLFFPVSKSSSQK